MKTQFAYALAVLLLAWSQCGPSVWDLAVQFNAPVEGNKGQNTVLPQLLGKLNGELVWSYFDEFGNYNGTSEPSVVVMKFTFDQHQNVFTVKKRVTDKSNETKEHATYFHPSQIGGGSYVAESNLPILSGAKLNAFENERDTLTIRATVHEKLILVENFVITPAQQVVHTMHVLDEDRVRKTSSAVLTFLPH